MFIDKVPLEERVKGIAPPEKKEECEVCLCLIWMQCKYNENSHKLEQAWYSQDFDHRGINFWKEIVWYV